MHILTLIAKSLMYAASYRIRPSVQKWMSYSSKITHDFWSPYSTHLRLSIIKKLFISQRNLRGEKMRVSDSTSRSVLSVRDGWSWSSAVWEYFSKFTWRGASELSTSCSIVEAQRHLFQSAVHPDTGRVQRACDVAFNVESQLRRSVGSLHRLRAQRQRCGAVHDGEPCVLSRVQRLPLRCDKGEFL